MHIRPERPTDRLAIHDVVSAAFGRQAEADLVDRLRNDARVIASLVALADDESVAGHALYSEVWVDGEAPGVLASLAPLAVRPDAQRRGVGAALVLAGIDACASAGYGGVVLVGHPGYYGRFGFSHAKVAHLDSPYAGEACLARELVSGAVARLRGRIVYPRAFEARA
jgi:putative acetyltransferase